MEENKKDALSHSSFIPALPRRFLSLCKSQHLSLRRMTWTSQQQSSLFNVNAVVLKLNFLKFRV